MEKYNRSKELFDRLRDEMDAFFSADPQPYSSRGEFDEETWEWVERFEVKENPPLRLGVLLGDVVHNLRSALDHLMWQVTLLDGGRPNRDTQFPVVLEDKSTFDKRAQTRIPDLSPEHRDLVEKVQPYQVEEPKRHTLAVLNKLANVDKHQIVHPIYSATAWDAAATLDALVDSYQGGGPSPVHSWWLAKDGQRLEDGTAWLRIKFRDDAERPKEVRIGGRLVTGIAFGEFGLDSHEMPRMARGVLSIIQRFQAEFPETEFEDSPAEGDGD
jgi:hypothetical protein